MAESCAPFHSCAYLRSFVFIGARGIQHCCGTAKEFVALAGPQGRRFPDEELRESRRRIEHALNNGIPCPCTGCPCVERKVWPEEKYLCTELNYAESDSCNLNCVYCRADEYAKHSDKRFDCRPFLPTLIDMYDRNLLAPGALVSLAAGEPLNMEGLGEFVDIIMRHGGRIHFASNLTVRAPEIDRWLDANRVDIYCSLDCGTRDTFLKVRRRDRFDAVVANIRHYAAINPTAVVLKYICLPVNANSVDRDGFLDIAEDSGVRTVVISPDFQGGVAPEIMDFMGGFKYEAGRRGLRVDMTYPQLDAVLPDVPLRREVEAAYRRRLDRYADVPGEVVDGGSKGWVERVIRANDGGLWLGGWAYDKKAERLARDVVVFWRDAPLFAGVCRMVKNHVRWGKDTGFAFHSGDTALADAVLADPGALAAYARFDGDAWHMVRVTSPLSATPRE